MSIKTTISYKCDICSREEEIDDNPSTFFASIMPEKWTLIAPPAGGVENHICCDCTSDIIEPHRCAILIEELDILKDQLHNVMTKDGNATPIGTILKVIANRRQHHSSGVSE